MNCPTGFLWYQKEENQFLINESQQPDGWAPLPVSVNPKDLSHKDVEDLAEAISKGSHYAIYVDQNSPYASDSKDNRGQSSLRPFRTLERALIESARRSYRRGSGGPAGNDITDRTSIYLAPGIYDVENGFGGEQLITDYNRRQDAATLLIANKDYIVDTAYATYQADPIYAIELTPLQVEACKRDLSYFVDAVAKDIATAGNYYTLRAAGAILNPDFSFIPAYNTLNKRESTRQAVRVLRGLSRVVIKNQADTAQGGVRLPHIPVDPASSTNPCYDLQLNSDTLYEIILETLGGTCRPSEIEVNTGTDTANFPITGEPGAATLRAFNSKYRAGIILPRGVSIIGADLRKVIIRPKYVPDAHDPNVGRAAIFRMTGGNFFSGFTVFDKPGLESSHHKLTCFEFCGYGDLLAYYHKVALAFKDSSKFNRLQDSANLLRVNIPWIQRRAVKDVVTGTEAQKKYLNIFEAEIPSMLYAYAKSCTVPGNKVILDYANRFKKYHIDKIDSIPVRNDALVFYSSLFSRLDFFVREAISNRANTYEGGFIDNRIPVDAVNPTNPCQDIQAILHTFSEIILAVMNGQTVPETQYEPWAIEDVTPTRSEYEIVGPIAENPVSGASPYIYSASLRSRWGMCGIDADGSVVSGFKSFVAAQFTVISMQSDPAAFTTQDIEGEVEKRYVGTRSTDTADYRHFGYRVREGAYAQLVSCFCIAPAVHYWNESGGEFSITNSTSNFGDVSLYAKGFLDNKNGGGAFPQDTGHTLLGIKKPKNVDLTIRSFVLGYIKPDGTALDGTPGATPNSGTITLTGTANTSGYTIDDPDVPTTVFARLPGNVTVSAEVVSYSTAPNGETTLNVVFNQPYATNWVADENSTSYRRGLIGASLYFERYVDTRRTEDKLYKLIIQKAESTTQKRREPLPNYILRKGSATSFHTQPFDACWDDAYERGRIYYIESIKPTTDIEPLPGRTNYEMILLSGYANREGQMEYYEDAVATSSIDSNLDRDPHYPIIVDVADSVTRKAVVHILDLLEITGYGVSELNLSADNIIEFSPSEVKEVEFNKPSVTRCAGQTWEYMGYYNYDTALPSVQPKKLGEGLLPVPYEQKKLSKTQTQVRGGRIYATGMDEEGNSYVGNRILDLKTGDTKSINLGTSPQVQAAGGDVVYVIDYDTLTIGDLTTTTINNTDGITTTTLDVAGEATFGDVVVANDLTVGGVGNFSEVNVTFDLTADTGTFTDVTVTGTLNAANLIFNGPLSFTDLTLENLTVTENTILNDLTVEGPAVYTDATVVGGVLQPALTVLGKASIRVLEVVNSITTAELTTTGTFRCQSNAIVDGSLSVNTVTASSGMGIGTTPLSALDVVGAQTSSAVAVLSNSINASSGNYFAIATSGATTLSITLVPNNRVYRMTLRISVTSGTVAFGAGFSGIKWENNTPPAFTVGRSHLVEMVTENWNNGSGVWYASVRPGFL